MKRKHIIDASKALAHLNVFNAIVGILECGSVSGDNKAKDQIIRICRQEMQRQVVKHDAAIDAALSQSAGEAG